MALADLPQHSLESEITLIEEVHPPPPSLDTMSIYMISSSTDPLVSTITDDPSYPSLHCFRNNEEILESLTTHKYPWDDMHHCSFFLPEERVSQSDQFSVETKDFIHGKVDWFKNPIPTPDSFEEGNMANISPTIKTNISTNSDIVEEIMLGTSCSPEEVDSYTALFQDFHDIFSWS